MKNTNLKNKNGITLIALIITIIVMLILVAVTISMAVNGGLFGYAGNAVRDTKEAKEQEEDLSSEFENLVAEYTGQKKIIELNKNIARVKSVSTFTKDEYCLEKANADYVLAIKDGNNEYEFNDNIEVDAYYDTGSNIESTYLYWYHELLGTPRNLLSRMVRKS